MSDAVSRLPPLYPIINVTDAGDAAAEAAMTLLEQLLDADCSIVQLRMKGLPTGAMTALATTAVAHCQRTGTALIVNDRCDVAQVCKAAGVHLGHSDLPAKQAREQLGSQARVGFSTHSAAEVVGATADGAAAQGADYLGFGPIFESPTKASGREPRGLQQLAQACSATTLPVVAIGGVTVDTAADAWNAGAASVAVISELERTGDLPDLLRRYRRQAAACGLPWTCVPQ